MRPHLERSDWPRGTSIKGGLSFAARGRPPGKLWPIIRVRLHFSPSALAYAGWPKVRPQERAQVQLQIGTGSGSELVPPEQPRLHQRLYFVREVTSPISADCDGHQVSDRIWPQIDPMPRGARLK